MQNLLKQLVFFAFLGATVTPQISVTECAFIKNGTCLKIAQILHPLISALKTDIDRLQACPPEELVKQDTLDIRRNSLFLLNATNALHQKKALKSCKACPILDNKKHAIIAGCARMLYRVSFSEDTSMNNKTRWEYLKCTGNYLTEQVALLETIIGYQEPKKE